MFTLLFVTGCKIEPCDPGQTVQGGYCIPQMAPSSGGASTGGSTGEAGDGTSAAGSDATGCSPSSQFGDPCTATSDCLCPTNYCALPPGQAMGSCTHTGCLEDPSVCPTGFQCMDLSVFDPTLPSVCIPPS